MFNRLIDAIGQNSLLSQNSASETCILDPHFKEKHTDVSIIKYALQTDGIESSKQIIMYLYKFCISLHHKRDPVWIYFLVFNTL